jgi:hypothetical protein
VKFWGKATSVAATSPFRGLVAKAIRAKLDSFPASLVDDSIACWGVQQHAHLMIPRGTKVHGTAGDETPSTTPLAAALRHRHLQRACESARHSAMRKVDIAHGPACWIGAARARARRFGRSRGNPKYRRVFGV